MAYFRTVAAGKTPFPEIPQWNTENQLNSDNRHVKTKEHPWEHANHPFGWQGFLIW